MVSLATEICLVFLDGGQLRCSNFVCLVTSDYTLFPRSFTGVTSLGVEIEGKMCFEIIMAQAIQHAIIDLENHPKI